MDRWWLNLLLIPTKRALREAHWRVLKTGSSPRASGFSQGCASAVGSFLCAGSILQAGNFTRILQTGKLGKGGRGGVHSEPFFPRRSLLYLF